MTPVQRRVVVWLVAVLCTALTARLGVWQLSRAHEKQQAHERMLQLRADPPWHNADWPCQASDASALPQHKPVVLQGQWLAARTVLLDNRPMDGVSGFIVVTPLRLSGTPGVCDGRVVLVQRGWVPRDGRERTRLPTLVTPEGPVQVSGRLMSGLSRTYQLGSEADASGGPGPLLRQNADPAFWSGWLGQSPVVGAVLQVQAETPSAQPDTLLRHWPEPGSGQDKHLAYAAQWFALCALVTGLTVWFQIIRPRRASAHVPS